MDQYTIYVYGLLSPFLARDLLYSYAMGPIRAFDTLFPLYYELLLYIYHTQLDKATGMWQ